MRPFFLAHFVTTRIEPHHIPDFRTSNPPALEKFRTAKDRVISPELNQFLGESKQLILLFIAHPIKPTDLIVLAISVIVSVLCSAPFVAAAEHRHALRKKQRRQKIPTLTFAQRVDLRVVSRTFDAAIPRLVIVVTVAVVVAVRSVVLLVVADQVGQRETIVRGNKIYARVRTSPAVLIKIGTAGEPVSHFTDTALVAFPKTAHRIAIFAIPFRPKHGKIPDLVAALAHVPRFRD